MDFDDNQSWVIARADVTFETMLKSGHFANIYKASLNNKKKQKETVAAKTLKGNVSVNSLYATFSVHNCEPIKRHI